MEFKATGARYGYKFPKKASTGCNQRSLKDQGSEILRRHFLCEKTFRRPASWVSSRPSSFLRFLPNFLFIPSAFFNRVGALKSPRVGTIVGYLLLQVTWMYQWDEISHHFLIVSSLSSKDNFNLSEWRMRRIINRSGMESSIVMQSCVKRGEESNKKISTAMRSRSPRITFRDSECSSEMLGWCGGNLCDIWELGKIERKLPEA